LATSGLPTTRHEDFKYTDLRPIEPVYERWLAERSASTPAPAADDLLADLQATTDIDWIVIRNGDTQAALAVEIPGIAVRPLSETASSQGFASPLAALNLALLEEGLRLDINAAPQRAIGLLFLDDAQTASGVSPSRVAIRIADNLTADVVEYHASFGDENHYSNAFLTLDIAPGGNLHHTRVQDRGLGHSQTHSLTVNLERDASFQSAAFDLGGHLTRNDLRVELPEPGAAAEFHGLYLTGDGQHVDNHTRVDHRVGPARSRQEYRGILAGRSRAVWNGKALVYEGADGTDAEQSNHNLLLSDSAEIDTKPELEIYAEDVRCSHGTTVGQLDEKALFYLRSRGLAENEARRLLVKAFAAQTLDSIPVSAIRERVAALLDERLQSLRRTEDAS
jgi:Fe-S cluster assembly protein SufD